jgi:hypothetical protein
MCDEPMLYTPGRWHSRMAALGAQMPLASKRNVQKCARLTVHERPLDHIVASFTDLR